MSFPRQRRGATGQWVIAALLLLGVGAGVLTVWWHHVRGQEEERQRAAAGRRRADAHDGLARMAEAIERVLLDGRTDVAPTGPIIQWIDPKTKKRIDDGMTEDPWGGTWTARFVTPSEIEVVSGGADNAPGGTGEARDVRLSLKIDLVSKKVSSSIEDVEVK